ncbi:MAG: hypothetical protein ACP5UQ_06605 [Anaerolineae bacterium]
MSTAATASRSLFLRPDAWRQRIGRLARALPRALIILWIALAIPSDGYLGRARTDLVLRQAIGPHGFRLAAWEGQALAAKARDLIVRPAAGLDDQEQHDLVVSYFDTVSRTDRLRDQIERIYADPNQADPRSAAAPLQAQLDDLRAQQARLRPVVEQILAQQVSQVLAEEGLTTAGVIWPPVSFVFAESPNDLIVSPRYRIAVAESLYLDPALSVAQMEQIERQVERELDVSALVEATGGFSSYPTMIVEYPDMEWVISTIAHEWVHTYLAFRPLGWRYYDSGAMRTINETVASIVGDEIGRRVIERFYPEKAPPASWPQPRSQRPDPKAKPAFSFGAFMRETRLKVDQLLAEGKIVEAENYMEARRKELAGHGYLLRRLNQAYFAFHGSYAVGPAATDPIGGKLRLLRRQAGSLAEFMRVVSGFRHAADLDAALAGQ